MIHAKCLALAGMITLASAIDNRAGPQLAKANANHEGDLLTVVKASHIQVVLDMRKMKYMQTAKDKFEISHKGRAISLTNFGKDCLLYTGFNTSGKGDLNAINHWNSRDVGATRAYLDEDRDPCLEMDIDVEGGISPFAFSLYFDQFMIAVDQFSKDVVHE